VPFQYLGTKPFCISPYGQLFYVYFEGHHPIFIAAILGDCRASLSPCKACGLQHVSQSTPLSFKGILQMFADPRLAQHVGDLVLFSLNSGIRGGKCFGGLDDMDQIHFFFLSVQHLVHKGWTHEK
jgi:hypothetical protein